MRFENFEYLNIPLRNDYEGECKATFISADSNTVNRPSVLYIHGFIDYFFHPHLAKFFDDNGYNFYALELRKYGHSLMPYQHPNYCKSVYEYFEELDISILKIKKSNPNSLVLLGHSTGGLITSLYLNKGLHRDKVSALILNSPFLEMNMTNFMRGLLKPITGFLGKISPYGKVEGKLTPIYPKSIHKDHEGEWEFDIGLKPIEGFPVYFKWSNAIMTAQDELMEHSNIKQPVLLLHASDSYLPKKHEPRVMKADIVLNVADMKAIGPTLGEDVTLVEIKDGMHDLFLSPSLVRKNALEEMLAWCNAKLE